MAGRTEIDEGPKAAPLTQRLDRSGNIRISRPRETIVDERFSTTETRLPRTGEVVGPYLITGVLGSGGYGMVYRGVHRLVHRPVAIKMPRTDEPEKLRVAVADLRREARLLAKLDSPYFVRVLDYAEQPPRPWLVLEYVNGATLAELISQSGGLQIAPALRILSQVADAMAFCEEAGIAHNDLKPANVLVTKTGQIKIADLGLAQFVGAESPGKLAGTITHLAPELLAQSAIGSPTTDVYSFGVTCYETLTGLLPFSGDNALEVMIQHATYTPAAPQQVVPDVPRWLSELVVTMLAKDADRRPQFGQIRDEFMAKMGRG